MEKASIISILNHKGGVGKSTLTTNLAAYFASMGKAVMIGDFDVQQSSSNWLFNRPRDANPISSWDISNGRLLKPSQDVSHIVVDSPAGLRGDSLHRMIAMSDKIIVPLKPGFFDMISTKSFLDEVQEVIQDNDKAIDLCVIGNMVDYRTKAAEQLLSFLQSCGVNTPTMIRHAHIYIHLVAHGLSIFDSKTNLFEKEIQQWQPLLHWLEQPHPTPSQRPSPGR